MKRTMKTVFAAALTGVMAFSLMASAEEIVRVGGMKGPTTMGIVSLGVPMVEKEEANVYEKIIVNQANRVICIPSPTSEDLAMIQSEDVLNVI